MNIPKGALKSDSLANGIAKKMIRGLPKDVDFESVSCPSQKMRCIRIAVKKLEKLCGAGLLGTVWDGKYKFSVFYIKATSSDQLAFGYIEGDIQRWGVAMKDYCYGIYISRHALQRIIQATGWTDLCQCANPLSKLVGSSPVFNRGRDQYEVKDEHGKFIMRKNPDTGDFTLVTWIKNSDF